MQVICTLYTIFEPSSFNQIRIMNMNKKKNVKSNEKRMFYSERQKAKGDPALNAIDLSFAANGKLFKNKGQTNLEKLGYNR